MTAEGIRIGNLLSKNGNIIEVKGISPHCGDYAINTDDSWVYLKNCEPILLSEEWLLKFGFGKRIEGETPFTYPQLQYKLGLIIIERYDKGFLCEGINIKYIHQLQNLYFELTDQKLILKQ